MSKQPISIEEADKKELRPFKVWFVLTLFPYWVTVVIGLMEDNIIAAFGWFVLTGLLYLVNCHAWNLFKSKQQDIWGRDWTDRWNEKHKKK